MEICILGSGSGMPSRALSSSAVLVRSEGLNYLLDAGEGVSKSLLEMDIQSDYLDAIIITHYHPDHVGGLFLLIQMLYLAKRTKPLSLFLPEREQDFLDVLTMFYTFPEKFGFELRVFPVSRIQNEFPSVECIKNDHLLGYQEIIEKNSLKNLQQAFSIRINAPQGAFVYSSDISSTDCILPLIQGAHTLLVDAGHPEAEQIFQLKDCHLKRILLTHEPKTDLSEALREEPCSVFENAVEGKIYRI